MSSTPLVSIILATYNRSVILGHAIESVRRSTVQDWELIVVGDCCTDDSAAVVASFGDARVSFVNLAENVGEQSGPNNEGVRRARGRYIAYLNHDDLYFEDHLDNAIAGIEAMDADFVWSPFLTVLPASPEELAAGRWTMRLNGVTPADDYDPRVFVFASAWLMTRSLAERVGPWRHAHESFVTPSQDLMFRAWRSGARMRRLAHPSVLALPGGARPGSYVAAPGDEHAFFAALMRDDPRFREQALASAAVEAERDRRFRLAPVLRSVVMHLIAAASVPLGVHPYAPLFALRYGRRGNVVNAIRRRTGLGRLAR
jgi:glycosyltransferase involved in cell wall biosynthesis